MKPRFVFTPTVFSGFRHYTLTSAEGYRHLSLTALPRYGAVSITTPHARFHIGHTLSSGPVKKGGGA